MSKVKIIVVLCVLALVGIALYQAAVWVWENRLAIAIIMLLPLSIWLGNIENRRQGHFVATVATGIPAELILLLVLCVGYRHFQDAVPVFKPTAQVERERQETAHNPDKLDELLFELDKKAEQR